MRRIHQTVLLLLLLSFAVGLSACENGTGFASRATTRQFFAMDTVMNLSAYSNKAEDALQKCVDLVQQLEKEFSTNLANSDISNLNRNAGTPVPVHADTRSVLQTAQLVSALSGGAFDISIGPLVQLWGFTTGNPHVPPPDKIEALLPFVDHQKIQIDGDLVTIPQGSALDLGGIGKGYAGQKMAELLQAEGVHSAMLSLGGNIQLVGTKPGGNPWHVAIQDPERPNAFLGTLALENCAVITSGSYQRYFEENGITYHHIINPKTGYPVVNGLLSVTIVAKDGTYADALSTACFVLGKDNALALWREKRDFDMILVNFAEEVTVTCGLANNFVPAEKSNYTYTFANY